MTFDIDLWPLTAWTYVTRRIKRYLKGPSDKIEILTSFSRANLKL